MSISRVRLVPFPDESIPSMLRRYGDALSAPVPAYCAENLHALLYSVSDERLAKISEHLGVPIEERRFHVMDSLDEVTHSGRGGGGTSERRFQVDVSCPRCRAVSMWAKFTQVLACERCEILLSEQQAEPTAASADLLAAQRTYLAGLTGDSMADPARIERLLILQELLVRLGWQTPSATLSGPVTRGSGQKLRDWRRPNAQSAAWLAAATELAWPHTTSTSRAVELALDVTATLSGVPQTSRMAKDARRDLHAYLAATGIRRAHIPDFLLGIADISTHAHTDTIGVAISVALCAELAHASGVHPRTTIRDQLRANTRFGSSLPVQALVEGLRSTPPGLSLLAHEAAGLVSHGLTDYTERARLIDGMTSIPRTRPQQRSSELRPRQEAFRVRFIQTLISQRPVASGSKSRNDFEYFARAQSPESKLAYLDIGERYLSQFIEDVERSHPRNKSTKEATRHDATG